VAFSFSAAGASGTAGGQFVHRYLTSMRHHRSAVIPFPPPTGPQHCLEFAESEAGWVGELADGRTVTTYARFAPRVLNATLLALNRLHHISALPRAAFVHGRKAVHSQATAEPVTEWVAVLRQGTRLAARTIEGQG
jgi:hypothetical protein